MMADQWASTADHAPVAASGDWSSTTDHSPQAPQDWSDKLGLTNPAARAVVDLGEGATAGLASTIFHGGDLVRRMTGQDRIINDPAVQEHMRAPASFAGGAGRFLEQAAEFAGPGALAREATAGAGLLARTLAQAGVGAGVSAAQTGGDPVAAAAGGAIGGGAELIGPVVAGAKAAIADKAPTLANWAESFGNATPTQKARISKALDVLTKDGIVPPDSVHDTQDIIKSKLGDLQQAYQNLDPAIKARGINAADVVADLQKLQNQYTRRGVVTNDELYNAVSDQIEKIQAIAKANGGKLNVDDLVHMKAMANGRTNWQSPDVEQSLWNNIGDAYRRAADVVAPETTPLNRDFQKYSDLERIIDKNIAEGKGTTPSGLDLLAKKAISAAAGAKAGAALGAPLGPVGVGAGTLAGTLAGPRLGKAAAQALQNAVDSGAFRALSPVRQGLLRTMSAMGDNAGVLKLLGTAATEESVVGR